MSFWIDVHAHLDDAAFGDALQETIERAEEAGIGCILSAGVSLASSWKTLEIAQRFTPVYAALGVHPQEVKEKEPDFSELEQLLASPKVVAVGEVGLDYYWDRRYVKVQEEVFIAQIEIAERHDLPLIVHSRSAEERVLAILRERALHVPVIWHCFSGNAELLERILSLGFYLSLNGIVTYPKAVALRSAIASAPLKRVFLETDAPYLAPQEKRGKQNEPAFLLWTARFLAEFWKIDIYTLRERLFSNFQEVFGKGKGGEMIGQELSKEERGYTI